MESKDKPNIRSHTNNKSTVREVSHRNEKNLRTQLMSSKSLQTSNCNSPYFNFHLMMKPHVQSERTNSRRVIGLK